MAENRAYKRQFRRSLKVVILKLARKSTKTEPASANADAGSANKNFFTVPNYFFILTLLIADHFP